MKSTVFGAVIGALVAGAASVAEAQGNSGAKKIAAANVDELATVYACVDRERGAMRFVEHPVDLSPDQGVLHLVERGWRRRDRFAGARGSCWSSGACWSCRTCRTCRCSRRDWCHAPAAVHAGASACGPTGETGAAGATGAQGPAGPQGATGATGAYGCDWRDGCDGCDRAARAAG